MYEASLCLESFFACNYYCDLLSNDFRYIRRPLYTAERLPNCLFYFNMYE